MSTRSNSSEARDIPPLNTFPTYGTNPMPSPITPPPSAPQPPQPPFVANAGTQTHRPHTPGVAFSSRIEIRGPDGTATYIPIRVPADSATSTTNSAGVQVGSEGPPRSPPGNPPVTTAAAAAAAASPGGGPAQQSSGAPPANPPRGPPPNAPPGAPPSGSGGAPGPNFGIPAPVANMNQATFVMPGQQPFLWVNPPVVSSSTPACPGYRSTQQSPYWTNTSYWLNNPPQQPQQYVYVAGYPTTYAYVPAAYEAPVGYYYV